MSGCERLRGCGSPRRIGGGRSFADAQKKSQRRVRTTATDLFGTITIDGAGTVAVLVQRAPGETAPLPVAVEAVVTDAAGQDIPRTHLAVGYDAREDRAPGTFRLSSPLAPLHESPSKFDLDMSQQARGNRIALTAGLFDGTIAARVDPSEVRVDYALSPAEATVRANADSEIFAGLTTSQPGDATFTRRLVSGADVDAAAVSLQQLPSEALLEIKDSRMTGSATASRSTTPRARLPRRCDSPA